MTQRNIKIIMAAIALGAPMMVSGFVKQRPIVRVTYLPRATASPMHHNVACQWVRDYRGDVCCLELPNDQSHQTSPGRKKRRRATSWRDGGNDAPGVGASFF